MTKAVEPKFLYCIKPRHVSSNLYLIRTIMIKTWKIFLANSILLLFLVACEKQQADEVKDNNDFAIEYQFINQGDTNIRDVVLYTFQKDIVFNDVKKFDTVKFTVSKTKCGECVDYLKVFVRLMLTRGLLSKPGADAETPGLNKASS